MAMMRMLAIMYVAQVVYAVWLSGLIFATARLPRRLGRVVPSL